MGCLTGMLRTCAISRIGRRLLYVAPFSTSLRANIELCHVNVDFEEDEISPRLERKSPAAEFGSQRIGAVVVPHELRQAISSLIAESVKPQIRNDAKRLFYDNESTDWEHQLSVKYRSRKQAKAHALRDGTAFASVVLPAHYSVIVSVLQHVKHRLEPDWQLENVLDWGAGTGSALWACAYTFQKPPEGTAATEESHFQNSSLRTYLAIDKRHGLTSIGKRLLRDLDTGSVSMTWQSQFLQETKSCSDSRNTLAISAFLLSSLSSTQARKALLLEMWRSGADVIVLIDNNTTSGFECIAQAREYLLQMGKKEVEDIRSESWPIRGSHVIAPCPHDGSCPLFRSGSSQLTCGFAQRLQRPDFVRRTKHTSVGHEDVTYSYVAIRRAPRPLPTSTRVGRIGGVGQDAINKQLEVLQMKELEPYSDQVKSDTESVHAPGMVEVHTKESPEELQKALRQEAYGWPRLVFPPLKRSGHVIIDGCTAEGKIMRMTIPKSQGKQAYYDARKSAWGDIFPHEPKNPPQERYMPASTKGAVAVKGADIGKRKGTEKRAKWSEKMTSYSAVAGEIKKSKKRLSWARPLEDGHDML